LYTFLLYSTQYCIHPAGTVIKIVHILAVQYAILYTYCRYDNRYCPHPAWIVYSTLQYILCLYSMQYCIHPACTEINIVYILSVQYTILYTSCLCNNQNCTHSDQYRTQYYTHPVCKTILYTSCLYLAF
jgi:hypothetical protein